MTREEAIRTLQFGEWWDFLSGEIGDFAESTLHEALNLAISAIREQEERRWIPVTERLPDQGDRVLCVVKSFAFPGSKYYNILRCDMYGFNENGIYTDDVTHWMPLPEPPKED